MAELTSESIPITDTTTATATATMNDEQQPIKLSTPASASASVKRSFNTITTASTIPQFTAISPSDNLVMSAKQLFSSNIADDEGLSEYLISRRKYYYEESSWESLLKSLKYSSTIYIGNLSFYTTEEQIIEYFSSIGLINRCIMGLNRDTAEPAGFCFIEYINHNSAVLAHRYLSNNLLDDRSVTADIDPGFEPNRQYGRSKATGGQLYDDKRKSYDSGRGGINPAALLVNNQNPHQNRFDSYNKQSKYSDQNKRRRVSNNPHHQHHQHQQHQQHHQRNNSSITASGQPQPQSQSQSESHLDNSTISNNNTQSIDSTSISASESSNPRFRDRDRDQDQDRDLDREELHTESTTATVDNTEATD